MPRDGVSFLGTAPDADGRRHACIASPISRLDRAVGVKLDFEVNIRSTRTFVKRSVEITWLGRPTKYQSILSWYRCNENAGVGATRWTRRGINHQVFPKTCDHFEATESRRRTWNIIG